MEFWSVLLTFVYGRLHGERRKTERKKFVNVSPIHHRRPTTEREEVLREILIIIIFRRGVFTNFIKQNYTERRKTERKKFVNVSPLHYRPTTERGKFFFREIKN